MIKNKKIIALILSIVILIITFSTTVIAITEMNNGTMRIYTTEGGLEFSDNTLKGFDIKGYIENKEISSTYSDNG